MHEIIYTVTANLPDRGMFDSYCAWLQNGHIQGVLDGGARSAAIIVLDEEQEYPFRVQSMYRFPDRSAFDRYVAEFAPKLRAEGIEKFGPQTGVVMTRTIGSVETEEHRA